jgi:hypothetical protein
MDLFYIIGSLVWGVTVGWCWYSLHEYNKELKGGSKKHE